MTPLYGCALLPPLAEAEPLARIRARFDPGHAAHSQPHVTLKQPFLGPEAGSAAERVLVESVTRATARFAPLTIRLAELGSFGSPIHGHVVYAKAEGGAQIYALARALIDAVEASGFRTPNLPVAHEKELYFPHLTLAQGLSAPAAEAMLAQLIDFEPRSFVIHSVGIGRRLGDGTWLTPFACKLSARSEE